ncbi:hypothetical protein O1611_g1586 [Lasiodiplodia mahajangana]|uniref:Uncharacterized protein n=1 Tax=Lasiodiplodia mahajangana TaxID=1108764 RepID=A0ACC2JWY2_9PEZI|nr:hypothetical protein O1611_g1586 [Lasiodiplodia mahajangana]
MPELPVPEASIPTLQHFWIPFRNVRSLCEALQEILRRTLSAPEMENNNLFFKLPAELRLAVYEFTVIQYVTGPRTDPRSGFTRTLIPPNLARVNRQIRQEVVHVYYPKNEFWIEVPVIKNHVYERFFAQCELAADFLPLIKSLCCEAYLVPDGDWSVVYYNTESVPDSRWLRGGEQELKSHKVDWASPPDSCESFWVMLRDMKPPGLEVLASEGEP